MSKVYGFYDLIMAVGIGWAFYAGINSLDDWSRDKRLVLRNILLIAVFTLILIDHLIKPEFGQTLPAYLLLCITRNIYYLIGPLLWIYSRSLQSNDSRANALILIHFLPFAIWTTLNLLFPHILLLFPVHPGMMMNPNGPPPPELHAPVPGGMGLARAKDLGSIVSVLAYGVVSSIELKQYQRRVPQFYSTRDTRKTLGWLSLMIVIIIIANVLILLWMFFDAMDGPIPALNFHSAYLRSFPAMLFLLYYSYFSRNQERQVNLRENRKKEKYQKQLISDEKRMNLRRNIIKAMESRRIYLNPELTLEGLAKELGESKHLISQVLNSREGENFYSFINDFRVKEFIRSIEENKYPNFSILGIAMECGFRSSSSFYSVFKKSTGKTPKQFISEIK